jgi:uncharacterized membrane protein
MYRIGSDPSRVENDNKKYNTKNIVKKRVIFYLILLLLFSSLLKFLCVNFIYSFCLHLYIFFFFFCYHRRRVQTLQVGRKNSNRARKQHRNHKKKTASLILCAKQKVFIWAWIKFVQITNGHIPT